MASSSSSSSNTSTTEDNNNNNNNKNDDNSFPTAHSVSFPFEPYPQQVDLMNAILDSLRLLQNNNSPENQDKAVVDGNTTTRTSAAASSASASLPQQQQHQQHRQASVWMLESPTGTGKSLSLAASVIAWLEHAEVQDLRSGATGAEKEVQQKEENESTTTATTATTKATTTAISWLDDWESPEERQAKKDWELVQSTARASRQLLQKHLASIQKQFVIDTSSTNTSSSSASSSVLSKQELQQRQRSKRQTVVRTAIAAARLEDQRGYYNSKNNSKRQRHQQQSKENSSNSLLKNQDGNDDDFCLDDYQSDNEKDDRLHDYDDDDSDTERSHQRAKGKDNGKLSAAMLLDGAALDGSASLASSSNKLPYSGPRMTLNMTAPSTATIAAASVVPTTTVGHVQPGSGVRKVVYAARTHSQLSQFTAEIQRQWPYVRVLALGGRKSLCGNMELATKSERVVNETCLDWQKNGKSSSKSTSKSSAATAAEPKSKKRHSQSSSTSTSASSSGCGCPLLSSRAAVEALALQLLAHPTDIEEAAALGKASRTCAYYATRQALAAAQVVVLPYSMLLAPATRHAIGLSLQQALVVIDEAHNLPEALRSLHSCRLTLSVINQAMEQLLAYTKRYQQRLANRNLYYLGRLGKILLSFRKHLTKPNKKLDGRMLTPGELLIALKLDNINLFKILRYLEHSRLAQKLLGFTTAAAAAAAVATQQQPQQPDAKREDQDSEEYQSKHVSSMSIVQTFLEKLTTSGKEGKIVTDRPDVSPSSQVLQEQEYGSVQTKSRGINNKATTSTTSTAAVTIDQSRRTKPQHQQPALRYVLLQPAAFFDNVLQEAHALALVGGTLRPFVHVAAELMGEDKREILQLAARADEAIATQQQSSSSSSLSSSSSAISSTTSQLARPTAITKQNQQQVSYSFVSPTFTAFSCDHVVSSSNVLLQCFSNGPSGQALDFRHQSRSSPLVCDELGRTVLRICQTVPSGVVVFLPSYAYEASLVCQWRKSGLWQQLRDIKKVHREPKSSQQVDATLSAYAKDASKKGGGALLLSVVGGKLSEGINFANELCRCVLVVRKFNKCIVDTRITTP
jgi:Rad3-related DNA helicase